MLCQFTQGTTQPKDGVARSTLAQFIDVPDVYPTGRLDLDSEGLLVLTDDGKFQHRVSDPKSMHQKTYWVQVEGTASEQALGKLCNGVSVQDYVARAARARAISEPDLPPREPPIRFRESIPTSWLEIVLEEGRNRQVRRMTAAVGLPTLRLIRVAIGALRLDGLAPGEWRDLTTQELAALNIDKDRGARSRNRYHNRRRHSASGTAH